jgi:hypothetical protein
MGESLNKRRRHFVLPPSGKSPRQKGIFYTFTPRKPKRVDGKTPAEIGPNHPCLPGEISG